MLVLSARGQQADVSKMSGFVRRFMLASNLQDHHIGIQSGNKRKAPSSPASLTAFVRINGDGSQVLATHHCRELARFGNIYIAEIPTTSLASLSGSSSVCRIEANESCSIQMDTVPKCVNLVPVYQGTSLPQAYTGKGVVVGVMDVGFDLTHPNFYTQDLSRYRIQRLWDQLAKPEEGTLGEDQPPMGVYVEGKESLLAYGRSTDGLIVGHGTHTLGTVAGSGYDTAYRGVAFDSDICLVANVTTGNKELIDPEDLYKYTSAADALGFKYIFDYAESVGKPCVISFSEGSTAGFYADDELFEEMLESMVGPGRILVAAAGNNGGKKNFFHKPVGQERMGTFLSSTSEKVFFMCATEGQIDIRTVIHKEKSDTLVYKVDASLAVSDTLEIKDTLDLSSGQYVFHLVSYPSCYNHQVRACEVLVTAPSPVGHEASVSVELVGKDSAADFYLVNGYMVPNALDPELCEGESSHNVMVPGCISSVICVGATSDRISFKNIDGIHQKNAGENKGCLASYSSIGPTIDGRIKPDVVAPGTNVLSSYNHFYTDANPDKWPREFIVARSNVPQPGGEMVSYPWTADTGTSMATPVVAGIIACWLEACPTLTPEQILDIFASTCRPVPNADSTPITEWPNSLAGYGEVDAYAGLLEVLRRYVTGIDALSSHHPSGVTITQQGDHLQISFEQKASCPVVCTLYGLDGRLLSRHVLCTDTPNVISLSHLPAGVYAAQISSSNASLCGSQLFRKQ